MSEETTIPVCDPDVFRNGATLFVTHTIRSADLEPWVRSVAARSGQRVDWHFIGGLAAVKVLGDFDRAREALAELKPAHDALFLAACRTFKHTCGETDEEILRHCPSLRMWWRDEAEVPNA